MTPGLIDSHYHLMGYGQQFWPGYLDIRHPRATSKADLLQLVGEYAAHLKPGEWVSGNQGFHLLPLKTMLEMGIPIAFGCDVPASIYQEPKWAFHGACMRRTESGAVLTPEERLITPEALRIHTMGSAYAGFAEATTGSLEPGKYADLVVWSHDLYNLTPAELGSLHAEMTFVKGEVVYDAGKS